VEDDAVLRAQQRDQIAFRWLMEANARLVWRIARSICAEHDLAEDAVQEAWLDVWNGLPKFRFEKSFRAWLLAVVANRCRMVARRHSIPIFSLDAEIGRRSEDDLQWSQSGSDVSERVVRSETQAMVRTMLHQLTADQQQILRLRFYADLELQEIALVLVIPLGTVKSRLHRALAAARTHLVQESENIR
jgi:RNA polymerase sigma-70 factor, ECF subfamily